MIRYLQNEYSVKQSTSCKRLTGKKTYVDVLISHVVVGLPEVLEQSASKTTEGNKDKSFLVEYIDFLRNEEGGQTSTESNISGLGDKRVTGQRVNNASSFLLGLNY